MRFTTLLGFLAASAIVGAHPTAHTTSHQITHPTTRPHRTSHKSELSPEAKAIQNSPPDGIIRVKDIDPNSPQGDLIIGKIWNQLNESYVEPTLNLTKRSDTNCYYSSQAWVLQDQVFRAKNGVCNYWEGADKKPYLGIGQAIWWDHYQTDSGTWEHLKDVSGNDVNGWWYLRSPALSWWSWDSCYNAFFELIWACHGSNPDTQGGTIWGVNGWEAQLEFFYA
ncbi:hypothetical protein ABW20_dc0103359 [Dactylellina cionopaga]|nr:hypothetical protein ABW20_dc0103359 [Dactylellina cionopaga]